MGRYSKEEMDILSEVWGEIHQNDPLNGIKIVEFESRSNGRNRAKRKSRGVSFLIRDGVVYQMKDGEIIPRNRALKPDVMTKEILSHLPPDQQTTENLIRMVRERKRLGYNRA